MLAKAPAGSSDTSICCAETLIFFDVCPENAAEIPSNNPPALPPTYEKRLMEGMAAMGIRWKFRPLPKIGSPLSAGGEFCAGGVGPEAAALDDAAGGAPLVAVTVWESEDDIVMLILLGGGGVLEPLPESGLLLSGVTGRCGLA